MSPSWSPLTTLVTNRLVGSTEVSRAVPVSSLAVDAGICGEFESLFHSTVPVSGSMTMPENWASAGLASWPDSWASMPAVLGILSDAASGAIFGGGSTTGGSTTSAVAVPEPAARGRRIAGVDEEHRTDRDEGGDDDRRDDDHRPDAIR